MSIVKHVVLNAGVFFITLGLGYVFISPSKASYCDTHPLDTTPYLQYSCHPQPSVKTLPIPKDAIDVSLGGTGTPGALQESLSPDILQFLRTTNAKLGILYIYGLYDTNGRNIKTFDELMRHKNDSIRFTKGIDNNTAPDTPVLFVRTFDGNFQGVVKQNDTEEPKENQGDSE